MQTDTHTDSDTHRDIQTQTHRNTHRQTETQSNTHRHTQTYSNTYADRHTDTQQHTHRHRFIILQLTKTKTKSIKFKYFTPLLLLLSFVANIMAYICMTCIHIRTFDDMLSDRRKIDDMSLRDGPKFGRRRSSAELRPTFGVIVASN